MTDFHDDDLAGARFENVRLAGASFTHVDLSGAAFRAVDLSGARFHGVDAIDVSIDGWVDRLVVNEVDVTAYVETELDRRYPGRELVRRRDADGMREAWALIEQKWSGTVARCRALDDEQLHASPDGEWSVVENLRHLVFAIDSWVRRAVLGDPDPYHPLGLPHTEMPDLPPVPRDLTARPSFEEVLAIHEDRMRTMTEVLSTITDEALAGTTTPVEAPGYPEPDTYPVARCLGAILNEEWEHRRYVERTLDQLP